MKKWKCDACKGHFTDKSPCFIKTVLERPSAIFQNCGRDRTNWQPVVKKPKKKWKEFKHECWEKGALCSSTEPTYPCKKSFCREYFKSNL